MLKFNGSLIRAGGNAKTVKGDKLGKFITAIMYLAPADLAFKKTVCAFADMAKCKAPCLNLSGQGVYSSVQQARINKTLRFHENREKFMADLAADIAKFSAKCERENFLPAVRLNGTSDILFERIPVDGFENIFSAFPGVQFYDYTKTVTRDFSSMPENYHLTLSYSGASEKYSKLAIAAVKKHNVNLAVVYRENIQSAAILDLPIIDGDETDLRFLDPQNCIVALKAKGKAKKDQSGFVLD